jgi:predicted transcriptional regulator
MARKAQVEAAPKRIQRSAKRKRAAPTKRSHPSAPTAPAQGTDFLDPRLTKALAHRMRVNIMAIISWRMIAPSEYARETGEKLSNVSYHFRRLKEYGVIELAKTQQVRGSTKHFYRAKRRAIFGGAAWTDLPKSVQDGVAGAALQDFTKVAVHSIESGAFSACDESYLVWEPLTYDELAFKAAVRILESTRERLLALQDESLPRLAKTGNDGLLVAVAQSCFEMGPA